MCTAFIGSAIVDAKAPDNAAAFKTWLRDISQKVVRVLFLALAVFE
jgi:hypothetical protein